MSQITSKLTYQINLPNPLEIDDDCYYSPIFGTDNKMFWQLFLQLDDNGDYYGLYLKPVASPDEINWRERSKLSYKLSLKEVKNNNQTNELINSGLLVPADTGIRDGYGYPKVIKKSSLQDRKLIIGVTFDNIKYKEDEYSNPFIKIYPKSIPKNLIDAWKDQLFDFQPADVEFSVQDEKFYACSSILSKRSEYLARILSGQWSESTSRKESNDFNFDNDVDIVDVENSQNNDKLTCQIKHRIKISKYDPIAFSAMLEYIYTDQVRWTNKDNNSITVELFRLADQYLLSDLRERAKIRILDELKISNVSKIMFDLVPRYEDLKEPVLEFMAKNFERVNNSKEFKDILANLVNYPNYDVILTEIWAECFKIQKSVYILQEQGHRPIRAQPHF